MGAWLSYGLGTINREPARLRRPQLRLLDRRHPQHTGALLTPLGLRLPPLQTPGRPLPDRRRPRPLPLQSRRGSTAKPAAACSTPSSKLNHKHHSRDRRPRNRHHHRPAGNGLPHAGLRPRTHRPLRRTRSTSPNSTAPKSTSPAPSPATASSPDAWSNAASASPSSSTAAGTTTPSSHNSCPASAYDVDQPAAALVHDLKQRGLLDDTLIVFAGEFGRTAYGQGKLERDDYGRDHHPRCFSAWLAGGGIKGGTTYGQTDDFSYNVAKRPRLRSRPPRHHAPPARYPPRPPHLPLPRPRPKTHRRQPRQSRQRHPFLRNMGPASGVSHPIPGQQTSAATTPRRDARL